MRIVARVSAYREDDASTFAFLYDCDVLRRTIELAAGEHRFVAETLIEQRARTLADMLSIAAGYTIAAEVEATYVYPSARAA